MYLDYSKIEFDRDGNPEMPELLLKTLSDKVIGVISGVHNLKLNIKFSEPSEISFDVPAVIDGVENPIYKFLCGHKQIYTKHYGIYEIMNPKTSADGISDVKHVTGYSYEKTLESKKFFLEEGTFNFWNPAAPTDTVLGRIQEVAVGWRIGYVSPTLIGKYRTFDGYDNYLLQFVYNSAPEKYRCVFVFDTYERSINVYDTDQKIANLPIYLDFDNLVEKLDITEKSDELVTALCPYGADDLDIRAVNPIGTNWLYDLSYFISNGDISKELADKWNSWQRSVLSTQMYYKGLVALQASSTARVLAEQAALTDLNGQLESLISQQSVTIQALAMETTPAGKSSQQNLLDTINANIKAKRSEISAKQDEINTAKRELESYTDEIKAIVDELSIRKYFTDGEYKELSNYMKEQDIREKTFVASTVDVSVSGESYPVSNTYVAISRSAIFMVDLTGKFSKKMFVLAGGTFELSGGMSISGDIIRGTIETKSNGNFVMSVYAGSIRVGSKTAASGLITISGVYTGLSSNVAPVTVNGVTTNEGTSMRFTASSGSMFLTANVSDYQKYSVQMELYDYAAHVLSDLATPTYEFTVDSGNFLFEQEFAPFRNGLELGKGVYLNVGSYVVTPYIIEFELSFEDRNKFSIVFSNRFKRPDETNTLADMIEKSYSSGRSFDTSKYIYNQTTSQASEVSRFMSETLDAAKNAVLGGSGTVKYDANGLTVGVGSRYQIRMVDRMIAMTDDNWEHAKVGIGLITTPDGGSNFVVNAEVVGGKLLVGNNLVIENENDTGVMQFKVDASGAWLNNSTFILQKDNGGKIIIDPKYGIVGGNGSLYTTSGTTVTPAFIDSKGKVTLDADGMPTNSNFYLDIRDGSVYFRGKIFAQAGGKIGGFTINKSELVSNKTGYEVGINGNPLYSADNPNYEYAFWSGSSTPARAKFWVKKNGMMKAKGGQFEEGEFKNITVNGGNFNDITANRGNFQSITVDGSSTFKGTLNAPKLTGVMTASNSGSWIEGCGIRVGKNSYASKGYNFYVDSSGNVTINGGSISWDEKSFPVQSQFSRYNYTYDYYWHDTMQSTDKYRRDKQYDGSWGTPYQFRGEDGERGQDGVVDYSQVNQILKDTYGIKHTNISGTEISSPTIRGAKIYGGVFYAGSGNNAVSKITENGISFYNSQGTQIMNIGRSMADGPIISGGGHGETLYFSFAEINFASVGKITGLKATATFG